MKLQRFLQAVDHDRIVAAIRAAESRSRGEIRVHASGKPAPEPQRTAAELFATLGMTKTAERNGVLILVAPASQSFAVVGDAGIHERCGHEFWREIASAMEADFRAGRFTDGLLKGIERAGEALARHFPRGEGGADSNELPDQVSED
jgi:uncharacterized membrane protein